MTNTDYAAKIRAEVEASIQAACADLLGKPNSREQVEEVIMRTLQDTIPPASAPQLHYSMRCYEAGKLTLRPKNLFTGLIMSGITYKEARPYVEPDADCAEFPQGTYRYSKEKGFTFQPKLPAEFIVIKLSLGEGGEIIE